MDFLLVGRETKRLAFREVRPTDFEDWLPFHQDKRTSEFWEGLSLNPIEACEQDLERTFYRYKNRLGGKNAVLLKETGQLIGQCGLLLQNVDGQKELEIGYSILPEYWKKGFATEAAIKCKQHAKKNKLAKTLISIIQVNNIPSQKVALANGMVLEKTTTYHKNLVHIFRVRL
ncbi:GNAT family N-acetyltransferase [Costertonia aggregata]|uniref:GNAT family N-acetyltransferase n=1 Tax=Costertonia aggregata TaxID=343403 RepID=A0A7H9ARR7_9FLAO|nr:GNAT family N-acetyltransferase [Costertonia aggregata]QLG46181.1 GNAT family N-acetyltransferase [Costertonia aggregata]